MLQDLGETEKLRWLVIDDKGKAVAQFREERRADAYVRHFNKIVREMRPASTSMH